VLLHIAEMLLHDKKGGKGKQNVVDLQKRERKEKEKEREGSFDLPLLLLTAQGQQQQRKRIRGRRGDLPNLFSLKP